MRVFTFDEEGMHEVPSDPASLHNTIAKAINPMPTVSTRDLFVMNYGHGVTQWGYRAPVGHLSRDLANPAYWADTVAMIKPGDWLFTTHTAPQGTYNAIYAFTSGPLGIWAQAMIASAPPVGA
jgi:hypothetical protein